MRTFDPAAVRAVCCMQHLGSAKDSYIRDMGLRYFDSVLNHRCTWCKSYSDSARMGLPMPLALRIVTAGRFTSIDEALRSELEECGAPWLQLSVVPWSGLL